MPSAQRSIVIDRSAEQVFDFFTNPANDPSWRTHVKEIAADGPLAPGSLIHQVIRGPGGRGIQADIEVTAHEPPRRYAFKAIAGPVRPVGEFRFAEEDGGTRVTLMLTAELTGLKKWLMARAVQRAMESETSGLERAKRLIES